MGPVGEAAVELYLDEFGKVMAWPLALIPSVNAPSGEGPRVDDTMARRSVRTKQPVSSQMDVLVVDDDDGAKRDDDPPGKESPPVPEDGGEQEWEDNRQQTRVKCLPVTAPALQDL